MALLPLPALADWRYVASDYSGEPLAEGPSQFAADGSRWSFGGAVRRTDVQGNTRLVRRSYQGDAAAGEMITGGLLLNDGGALLMAESGSAPSCTVQRINAQLRPTWRVQHGSPSFACPPPFANSAGFAWLHQGSTLRALGRDGSLGAIAQPGSSELHYFGRSGFVLADGSIIVSSSRVDSRNTVVATHLNHFARDGSLVWSWQHASRSGIRHLLPLGSDAIGTLTDFGTDGVPAVLRWNSSGNVVWSLPQPAGTRSVLALVAAAANEFYVLGGPAQFDGALGTIQRVSADGQLRWQHQFSCSRYFQALSVTLDANDGLALICNIGETRSTQLLRLDRNGTVATPLPLPLRDAYSIVRQPDGGLRVVGVDARTPSRSLSLIIDGSTITPAPADGLQLSADLYLSASRISADGSSYLALDPSPSSGEPRQQILLRKLDAQGKLVWSHTLDDVYSIDQTAGIAHNAGRVCALIWRRVEASMQTSALCLDADDGSELWRTATSDYLKANALRVLDDGRLVAVVSIGYEHEVRQFSADGQLLRTTRHAQDAFHALIDANGRATVVTPSMVSQYALDGSLNYRLEGQALPLQFGDYTELPAPAAFAGDDGSVWLTGPSRDATRQQHVAWAIAPDGATRWLSNIGTQRRGAMIVSGNALYIARWETPGGGGDGTSPLLEANYVIRLDKASGTLQWEYTSYDPIQMGGYVAWQTHTDGSPVIALSADGQQLLLMHSWRNRLRLQRVDTAQGQQQHERYIDCAQSCMPPRELAADAAGTLRTSVGIFDYTLGSTAAVLALDHAAGPMPRIRLDQAGIGGAWWSPYANGEGIAFDWLPASRTVFAAWFTYANSGGNDTSGLRWYTVQVNGVANGATTLKLPILKTSGGNFSAGPLVSPQRVGMARLEFYDCSNGTLHYAFDPGQNDGRSGTITLSRLSPPTQTCILADGSSQPADDARLPLNGFDARMSGSWYEEATTGQGLQLTVQPGGVFFAPWFTFDTGRGNDEGRQHWFTLQGDLATANNGQAELQLIQTTGGVFDRVPTYNAYLVGNATLRMQACDRAQLDYRFFVHATPGPFQARSGTLNLLKAGGCTP